MIGLKEDLAYNEDLLENLFDEMAGDEGVLEKDELGELV